MVAHWSQSAHEVTLRRTQLAMRGVTVSVRNQPPWVLAQWTSTAYQRNGKVTINYVWHRHGRHSSLPSLHAERHKTGKWLSISPSGTCHTSSLPYYRATLCVSAVFAVAGCPTVRPSVRHVGLLYLDGWRYRQNFYQPVSILILIFLIPKHRYPIPRGTPSVGGAKCTAVGKFCDFQLKSPYIPETVRGRPMVNMER